MTPWTLESKVIADEHIAFVARQRREAQRAEAVRIVTAYNEWCEDLSAPIDDPNLFAAYLYPEPKEAE